VYLNVIDTCEGNSISRLTLLLEFLQDFVLWFCLKIRVLVMLHTVILTLSY